MNVLTDTYVEKGVTKYKYSLLTLYVDDLIIIACLNLDLCNELEKSVAGKFKMRILGEINHILGTDVKVNIPYNTIHLSQEQYIKNTYNTFKEYGIYNKNTPVDSRVHLSKAMSLVPRYEEAKIMKEIPYRELIGSLLWIANGILHWKALLRVLGYLYATQKYCVKYMRSAALVDGRFRSRQWMALY